nr:MAG TPA: hypothetical protein [Caudoviricetes sp.]
MMPVLRQHSYRPALTYISTAALQAVWGTAMHLTAVSITRRIAVRLPAAQHLCLSTARLPGALVIP